ncbi:ATP-binding cassette domain-containing protein [Psychroflexus gondwanensis]|uniref:ABC transporter ATP-binding protein n=1 Tax=Psychroflexus gondwanensis TaxID=251 RepID=UPI0011BE0572|nr:ABC transporter ATP-binding protein [Psychroflexus gondwanensis]TXE21555.1 ATP-binding cassette domain-containing protein [Psychroflexus gondwanensis]
MKNIILTAQNISKQYRLGLVGTGTLSHDLNRWWASLRGKEDPYLKIGAENDRSKKAETDYVWALRDINFDVYDGDVLGIIGKNGAGKSTLLKILSRVTSPTTGTIKTKGRIASLLEVGTGFHPELTGRENIYLNGAIMGMTKAEIREKEEEIIEFSGCQLYVDTPVKRYSSGMRVRLAFAVAAHLEPDILVVDEVLAVGDAEFQKKAIGKMKDISGNDGRTVLFVSHNMAAVKSLCTRGIVLENGTSVFEGSAEESVDYYLREEESRIFKIEDSLRKGNSKVQVKEINTYGEKLDLTPITGGVLNLRFKLKHNVENINSLRLDIRIDDTSEQQLIWLSDILVPEQSLRNSKDITFRIPKLTLNKGRYILTYQLSVDGSVSDWVQKAAEFYVESGNFYKNGKTIPEKQAKIYTDFEIILND